MKEIHSPSEMQELLGIDRNTLRKYAILLEGHGYHIHRNHRGHRGYFEKDVHTLRQIIELSKQKGVALEQVVKDVIASVHEEGTNSIETPSTVCNHDEVIDRIHHLEQLNADLIKLLKEKAVREAYFEEKINLILKYVERTSEQLEAEQYLKMEEETRKQIAAATVKSWWKWWK
ncbi:MerR family transcriptional regulator [Neobacillus sp. K501]